MDTYGAALPFGAELFHPVVTHNSESPQAVAEQNHQTPDAQNQISAASAKQRVRWKTCIICTDRLAIRRFPTRAHRGATRLNHDVCSPCWRQHLENEIATKPWDQVRCPECPSILTEPNLKRMALPKVYEAWLDKAATEAFKGDQELRACPSAACSSYQLHFDGDIFRCQLCGFRYCTACESPMHDDETCAQYQARALVNEQENLSKAYVEQNAKTCPGCKSNIVKISGCDHMTCKRCNHEFCWRCLAPYAGEEGIFRQGNEAHGDTCANHSARLERQGNEPDRPWMRYLRAFREEPQREQ